MKTLDFRGLGHAAGQTGLLFLALYLTVAGGKMTGWVLYPTYLANIVLLAAGGLLWMTWRLAKRRLFPATMLDAPILFFLTGLIISTLASEQPRVSLEGLFFNVVCILAYYFLADVRRSGKDLEVWMWVTLLAGLWYVAYSGHELFQWFESWLAIGGWQNPIPPATIRLSGAIGHANVLAAYLNLLWPLAAVRMFTVKRIWGRILLAFGVMISLGMIFGTSSRGGWLGTAAALAVLTLLLGLDHRDWLAEKWTWLRQRRTLMAGLALLGLAGLAAAASLLFRQAQNPSHPVGNPRGYIWSVALDAFRQRPLVGTGLNTFGFHFTDTFSVPPEMLLYHAHNYLLNVLAENGLWGLIAVAWMGGVVAWAAWRTWRGTPAGGRVLLTGSLAALAGLTVHSLFDTLQLVMLVNLLAALLVTRFTVAPGEVDPRKPISRLANGGLALLWLSAVGIGAYSLWGYSAFQRGVDAFNQDDTQSTLAWLDEAARRDPTMPLYTIQAGIARGRLAIEAGDETELARGIRQLEAGLRLCDEYAVDWAELGAFKRAAGDAAGAIEALTRAHQLAPKSMSIGLSLGRELEAAGRADEALAVYDELYAVDPLLPLAGFFDETALREEWAKSHPATPLDPSGDWPAWQALAEGNAAHAERLFREQIGLNTARLYLGLSMALETQGRQSEADYARAVALFIDPNVRPPGPRLGLQLDTSNIGLVYNRQILPQDEESGWVIGY